MKKFPTLGLESMLRHGLRNLLEKNLISSLNTIRITIIVPYSLKAR